MACCLVALNQHAGNCISHCYLLATADGAAVMGTANQVAETASAALAAIGILKAVQAAIAMMVMANWAVAPARADQEANATPSALSTTDGLR